MKHIIFLMKKNRARRKPGQRTIHSNLRNNCSLPLIYSLTATDLEQINGLEKYS